MTGRLEEIPLDGITWGPSHSVRVDPRTHLQEPSEPLRPLLHQVGDLIFGHPGFLLFLLYPEAIGISLRSSNCHSGTPKSHPCSSPHDVPNSTRAGCCQSTPVVTVRADSSTVRPHDRGRAGPCGNGSEASPASDEGATSGLLSVPPDSCPYRPLSVPRHDQESPAGVSKSHPTPGAWDPPKPHVSLASRPTSTKFGSTPRLAALLRSTCSKAMPSATASSSRPANNGDSLRG